MRGRRAGGVNVSDRRQESHDGAAVVEQAAGPELTKLPRQVPRDVAQTDRSGARVLRSGHDGREIGRTCRMAGLSRHLPAH